MIMLEKEISRKCIIHGNIAIMIEFIKEKFDHEVITQVDDDHIVSVTSGTFLVTDGIEPEHKLLCTDSFAATLDE